MNELLTMAATSSILILIFVLLRAVFFKKISMRLQYALWLFAAAKLLIFPVPHLKSVLSVQNLLQPVEHLIEQRLPETTQTAGSGYAYKDNPAAGTQTARQIQPEQIKDTAAGQVRGILQAQQPNPFLNEQQPAQPQKKHQMHPALYTAMFGSIVLFLYFLTGNLRFAACLRRKRVLFKSGCPLPVYVMECLPSPCLYGKSIYITPRLASDEKQLFHVLVHEYCHYRHGDFIWSLLRCLCLVIYWWNPLVWLAAFLSRQDCELACDEAAIHYLGKQERISYGKTLVSLAAANPKAKERLLTAASMSMGGRNMKKRIQKIAQNEKYALPACILAGLLSVICFVSVSTAMQNNMHPEETTVLAKNVNSKKENPTAGSTAGIKENSDKNNTADADSNRNNSVKNADTKKENSTVEETAVTNLDQAVGLAILDYNKGRYAHGECTAEGHLILGQEKGKNGQMKVYVLTMYGEYVFHNNYFIKDSGTGDIPAVIKFTYNKKTGYLLKDYKMPMDGGLYIQSIKENMGIPEHLWEICISPDEKSLQKLEKLERRYAKKYLKSIGRKAAVGNYSDIDHPLLTDAGVSVKVSNKLCDKSKYRKSFSYYPDWIGNLERIENGVRYVYEMSLDKKAGEIIYTKSVYDTGKEVEKFSIDMKTGKEIVPAKNG